MKIVRYLKDNEIFYGKIDNGKIRKIKGCIFDEHSVTQEEVSREEIKLLAPVMPYDIIAIGLNYKKHVDEGGRLSYPERPAIFLKARSSLNGPDSPIIIPSMAPDQVDYEGELVIVIGKKAKNIEKEEVKDYIFGYTCGIDVSARDCQRTLDVQWARGKSFDTFATLGPWIETSLPEPNNCTIMTKLNGKIMQNSSTSYFIFNTEELVSYCSKNFTLYPGTVIMTGTPEGVGFARKPPVFMKPGDTIEVNIEGIGTLSNNIVKA